MATEIHTFDPDGDLLLILSRPTPKEPPSKCELSADGAIHTPTESEAPGNTEEGATGTAAQEQSTGEEAAGSSAGSFSNPTLGGDDESEGRESDEVVNMLVSSKHMMLASPVFKAMLQRSTFKEGTKLSSAGKVEVPLPDDNPTAFIIVLDVIHGRNKRVPRKMDLEMLARISVIVDKYQMAEAVESYSDG